MFASHVTYNTEASLLPMFTVTCSHKFLLHVAIAEQIPNCIAGDDDNTGDTWKHCCRHIPACVTRHSV